MKITTLIVDDEELARARLRQLLEASQDFIITGQAASGEAAIASALANPPDVIFLDIEMPDLSGFEVLETLQTVMAIVPEIIFVTAFDQYAVQAFEANARDYVLKPIEEGRFTKTVDRVRRQLLALRHRQATATPMPSMAVLTGAFPSSRRYLRRFVVPDRGQRVVVSADDVECITAADNYVDIFIRERKYLLRAKLGEIAERLNPEDFVRIHRSVIVGKQHVRKLTQGPHGEYDLHLRSGRQVRASRAHRRDIRALLQELEGSGSPIT